jgi:hypothetical protein
MSLNLSAAQTSNKPAIRFKNLLARIYLAFDESQRRRAAAMIDRYRRLQTRRAEYIIFIYIVRDETVDEAGFITISSI